MDSSGLSPTLPKLGLRENAHQFFLLVLVNAFVGAMIGLERSILPELAEKEFFLAAKSAILSFIVVFGFTKALMNYFAGRLSDKFGRKHVLVMGWLFAIPVPFLLMWAPSWSWILIANVFLGISQGLTWSTTVIMKIDLVGSKQRGLAMGLNEFAGYFAVAGSALFTGLIASHYGVRPEPFYLGILYVVFGLLISFFFVKETRHHVQAEINSAVPMQGLNQKEIFLKTSFLDRNLSSVTQAGFVNNLNDGMAWGLFPILFASVGLGLREIGWLAAIYPASWGILQLFTGHLSDKVGRKWLIVWGMWIQAVGIAVTIQFLNPVGFFVGALLLGAGTAMVYPTLLAAIGDVAHPSWRASSVGVYRLWRDSGYAIGALVSGVIADSFGLSSAIWFVAFITFLSGVVTAIRQSETLPQELPLVINVDDLDKIIGAENAVVLDVRSPEEFVEGHIHQAIHRPKDGLPESIADISKSTRIITNCGKGGGRSTDAAKLLREKGWSQVQWLEGGYNAWKEKNKAK
jgi:MFS family permease